MSVDFAAGRRYILQREMLELQAHERSMTPLAATFLLWQNQQDPELKPVAYVAAWNR